MSTHDAWKALHLLYVSQKARKGLDWQQLSGAGITCYADTFAELEEKGLISEVNNTYVVSPAARYLLREFVVAQRQCSGDLWVDYPEAFVAMPYREDWSTRVYLELIEPAAKGADLACIRADRKPLLGDIRNGLWESIFRAGVVIADVSVPNTNVFYELGMAHALGKQAFLLKRPETELPADFGGFLSVSYDLNNLERGRHELQQQLTTWAKIRRTAEVKNLLT